MKYLKRLWLAVCAILLSPIAGFGVAIEALKGDVDELSWNPFK